MPPRDLERRRPRPVADAPAADPAAVAKAWLLELLRGTSLAAAARVPTQRLAADGPPLCALLLDALRSDAALEDLVALAERAAALTGATDAAGVARAAEALRTAVWTVVAREVDDDLAAGVADRLAHLCALVSEAALRGAASGAARTPSSAASAHPIASSDASTPHRGASTSLDELEGLRAARDGGGGAAAAVPYEQAIERRLHAYSRDGRPFTVLVVEVDDADRLAASGAEEALARAEDAVARALRPADLLTRETPGRLWVTAPDTAGVAATDLAGRLAGAVPGAAALHGTSLRASVGVATCPDDGTSVDALVAHADERLYAARAAGLPIV